VSADALVRQPCCRPSYTGAGATLLATASLPCTLWAMERAPAPGLWDAPGTPMGLGSCYGAVCARVRAIFLVLPSQLPTIWWPCTSPLATMVKA
jgi:hypothetical protein